MMTPEESIEALENPRIALHHNTRHAIADAIRSLLRDRHKNFNPGIAEEGKFVTGPVGPTPQDQIHQVKNQKGIPEK